MIKNPNERGIEALIQNNDLFKQANLNENITIEHALVEFLRLPTFDEQINNFHRSFSRNDRRTAALSLEEQQHYHY